MSQSTAIRPSGEATSVGRGTLCRALTTDPAARSPEQKELLSRPEVRTAARRLGQQLAPAVRQAKNMIVKAMVEHPEVFDDPQLAKATGQAYKRGGWDALRKLHPVWQHGGRHAVIAVVTRRAAGRGHAPRAASNEHRRGSRRGDAGGRVLAHRGPAFRVGTTLHPLTVARNGAGVHLRFMPCFTSGEPGGGLETKLSAAGSCGRRQPSQRRASERTVAAKARRGAVLVHEPDRVRAAASLGRPGRRP